MTDCKIQIVNRNTLGMGILRQGFGIPWPTCPDEDSGLPRSGAVEVTDDRL